MRCCCRRADTVPAAVQALYLSGHEIATHTLTHPSYPSAAEIVGAREWLVKQTGIPRQRINGYRCGSAGGQGGVSVSNTLP